MEKAKTTNVVYIDCPHCGAIKEDGPGVVSHLFGGDTTFGPWHCRECGKGIKGTVKGETVLIEKVRNTIDKSFVLLRLDPQPQSIFFIVKGMIHNKEINDSGSRYFYNEGTCPTNYMQDVQKIIVGQDDDPHGLCEFIKMIPAGDRDIDIMNVKQLANMFDTKELGVGSEE